MADYRIYLTDSNGSIRSGEDFSCQTDEQARLRALSLLGRYERVEVWIGTKRVCIETSDRKTG